MAQGQLTGVTIYGQVVDGSNNPVPGIAVFNYGSLSTFQSNGQNISNFYYWDTEYTSGNGAYSGFFNQVSVGDSLLVGVVDCNMNLVTGMAYVSQPFDTVTINLQVNCIPAACDANIGYEAYSNGPANWSYTYYAQSLRDSSYANINSPVTHTWSYNGITRSGLNKWQGPNLDTLIFNGASATPPQVCYQRMSSCSPVCTGGSTPAPTHYCNADFFVDSVNSINFNGQVVVWENSTTDSGATIVGYRWDFGDGSPTVNQQYPIHTYNDTNVYQVCLTIVSVKPTSTGIDSCTSTYCDSIGFDSNGNLVYKSSAPGFTINVVDPATVGQQEIGLESNFNLYPNPTRDEATLAWDASIGVEQVDVISINGQLIKSITPNTSSIKLNGLETGVYILRVKSEQGEAAVRMMVQ